VIWFGNAELAVEQPVQLEVDNCYFISSSVYDTFTL